MKLALSTLCENPLKRTGLSTLFPEFVAHSRRLFPEIAWVVFAGRDSEWEDADPAVEVCRDFASNERPICRLIDDHFKVAHEARRRGASALLTVGFLPAVTSDMPVAMHVFSVHHLRGKWGLRDAYRRWAVNRGLKRAAIVVTNSIWTRSQIGQATAPIIVSPEGLRHDLFKPDGPAGAPGIEGAYLLWVSNLYPYKRIELVLAAFAALAPVFREMYTLVIVGGDWAGGRAGAEASAKRLGIGSRVRFLGWVRDEDMPAIYRGAYAHVLSTSEETFGRSVLEAMACGCLNIVQDLPVLREVAVDSALYVDFADSQSAARMIERACADIAGRARLTAAGIERSKDFSFERLTRERVSAILSEIGTPLR